MLIRLLSCVLVLWVVIAHVAAQESPATLHVSALTSELTVAPVVVRVQLDLTIANPSREEREHVLDLRVPESAAVDRFGLWVQGRYLEGEIAPRALGRRLYREVSGIDDPNRVKRDPALLTWEGPGLLRLRVFPVPPEGTARLRLSYVVLRPLRGDLVIPAVLDADALRSPTVTDTPRTVPAPPPPADQVQVHAFGAKAGEPGYFLALVPVTASPQQGPVLTPEVELVVRDTSRAMDGRHALGSPLQRDLAARLTAPHPVFLLDADVVPHPVVALDVRTTGSEPTCGGTFDLAAALHAAEVFLAGHAGKRVRLTLLGDLEPTSGAALVTKPVLPRVPDGQVWVSCATTPSWLRAFAPALLEEHAFTDLTLDGVDGVEDPAPTWFARAAPGGYLVVFGRHRAPQGTLRIRQRAPDGGTFAQSIALTFRPDEQAAWLPRLWADAEVRALAQESGRAADAPERERRQQEIARKYQVLAPASSFVVLSNERDYRANALERTARIDGWAERDVHEVISETPADPWRASSGQGASRFMIPNERTSVGVDRSQVWSLATSYDGEDVSRDEFLHRYLRRDEFGRWNDGRWVAGLEVPSGSWAAPSAVADPADVPPAVVARWGRQVPPVIAGFAGERWCWWREGERAVLQHLTADGTADWCVVIDQDGIRTALPEWGVWWRHQPDDRLVDDLLALAPSPTWLPLSWLSRFVHITAQARGGALLVMLSRRSQMQEVRPQTAVRGFLLPASGEVAPVHWVTYTHHMRDLRLALTLQGERLTVRNADGNHWELTWQPAPTHPRALPLPIDRPMIGVLDAAPIWRRLHTGAATAGDCWQFALAAPQVAESLPWLKRAHDLAPHEAGIILHLAAALTDCGHHAQVPALLARLDVVALPAWQRSGVRRLRQELTGTGPDPADIPTRRPRSEWPQVWTVPQQSYEEETALMQQIGDAVKQEQPERLVELLCQSTSGRVYYHGVSWTTPLTVMQAVFGDQTLSPCWQVPAARQVLSRLAQDPRGRAFFREALRNGGSEVIHAHLRELLHDPAQADLARLTLSPYYGKGHHPRRFSRRELLAFAGESYPPVVRTLAWVRLIRDHAWSIDDRAAAKVELHRRLATITQPDLRLRVMGDCLDLMSGDGQGWSKPLPTVEGPLLLALYDDVGALWDAALATHAAISDPVVFAAGQADLERVLEHVLSGVVVTHRRGDLAALLTRVEALASTSLCRPAHGHLRPLTVQLCRQAAAAGLTQEAIATANTVLADAPEPGLFAALTGATPRDLALRFDEHQRSFEGSIDVCTAPLAWWPEWQEDAIALARRCRSGVGQPIERVTHAIRERGLSRAVIAAAVADLPQQGPDLQWLAFTAPVDAEGARQVLAALNTMRQTLGMPTHAAYAAMRLAFRYGLMTEAQRELTLLLTIAPRATELMALQVAMAALDGDGGMALTHARAWIAARAPDEDLGDIYARSVSLLCATRRYQDAFVLRQEAVAFVEAAPDKAFLKDQSTDRWDELFSTDHPLLDQVVVPEGTVLFPRGWKRTRGFSLFKDQDEPATEPADDALAAQVALGRYPAIAAEAAAGFAQADTARRFAWFAALWIDLESRLGADCPPLLAWLRELVAQRAPLPPHHSEAILRLVAPQAPAVWLAYLRQIRAAGQTDAAPHFAWRARRVAEDAKDAVVLSHIADLDGKGLPDYDWIWTLTAEPPGFTARLGDLAVQRAQGTLIGRTNGEHYRSTDADRAWVAKHPDVRARIDVMADALLAERPDDALLWARCAVLGLGTRTSDAVWRRLVGSPLDVVEALRDGVLRDEIANRCLGLLIAEGRWDDVATFLRACARARVSFTLRAVPERGDLPVMAQRVGAVRAATTLAAMQGNAEWLIAAGFPDPTTHPDWESYRDVAWELRGDPERLEKRARQVVHDPFAGWEQQTQAHVHLFAAQIWRRDYREAVVTLESLVSEGSPAAGGSLCVLMPPRWQQDLVYEADDWWNEVHRRLLDDWVAVLDRRSPIRDEQAAAREEQLLARRLGFLHHCAHAPVDALSPIALFAALTAGDVSSYNLPSDRVTAVMDDLTRVLQRCIDQGFQEQLRGWLRSGEDLPFPESLTAESYPAFVRMWVLRCTISGIPSWPYTDLREWERAWSELSRGEQVDLLRQVSGLARMPGAEAWWPRWREDFAFGTAFPGLVMNEDADGSPLPPTDPWLGKVPPPEIWLAREAWWRTQSAAGAPQQ